MRKTILFPFITIAVVIAATLLKIALYLSRGDYVEVYVNSGNGFEQIE